MTAPDLLPCSRQDALVGNGAAAPKSCLPSLEMRTTSAAGDLLPTDKISTITTTTFNKTPLRLYSTEETNSRETNLWTSVAPAWYDNSFRKLLAAPFCRRVIETKSGQNRMFAVLIVVSAPVRFRERGARCFVVRLCVLKRLVTICSVFWRIDDSDSKPCRRRRTVYAIRIAVKCVFSNTARLKKSCRRGWLEVIECRGWRAVGERHGASSLTGRKSAEVLGAQ